MFDRYFCDDDDRGDRGAGRDIEIGQRETKERAKLSEMELINQAGLLLEQLEIKDKEKKLRAYRWLLDGLRYREKVRVGEIRRPPEPKNRNAEKAESTKKEYEKMNRHIPFDRGFGEVVDFLIEVAEKKSVDRYYMARACTLNNLDRIDGDKEMMEVIIRSFPPVKRCVSETTRKRRKKKDLVKLERATEGMTDIDKMAVRLCLLTGARQGELPSLRIKERKNGVAITIKNLKQCRISDDERNFFIKGKGAEELKKIISEYGEWPLVDWTQRDVENFRYRYRRSCVRNKVDPQEYSLHALRHQFASNQKKIFCRDRTKLDPETVKKNEEKIMYRLGHTSSRAMKGYGNSKSSIEM